MAVQFRWSTSPVEDVQDPVRADWGTFTEIFREHAEFIFEYCISLLSDDSEAAGATTVTFISAQALLDYLENHDRLEAWLYALARRECTSKHPARWEKLPDGADFRSGVTGRAPTPRPGTGNGQAGSGEAGSGEAMGAAAAGLPVRNGAPDGADGADGETVDLNAITRTSERRIAGRQALSAFSRLPEEDREVLAAFSALSPRDREVLDLVYWHGLSPVELPAILDISAQRAQTLLASAVRRFRLAAENVQAAAEESGQEAEGSGDKLAAAMPVATMPAAVWRHASRAVFDPELRSYRNAVLAHAGRLRPDGFPTQPAAPGARAQTLKVGAAILVPAAVGLAVLMYLVGSSSGTPAGQIALTTPDAPSTAAGTHHAAAAAGSRHGHAKARHGALPITSLFPGQPSQGILPVPTPGTSSYTPAPNPSTASSAPGPSSQPSSIAPPPSHKASPTPTTKASPTPTISGPSPTPTPTATSSGTSSSAGATTSPSAQTAIFVAIERLVPSGTIDRFLT